MSCQDLLAQKAALLVLLQSQNDSLSQANSRLNIDYVDAATDDRNLAPGGIPTYYPDAAAVEARITALNVWSGQNPGHEQQVQTVTAEWGSVLTDLNQIATINEQIFLTTQLINIVINLIGQQGC